MSSPQFKLIDLDALALLLQKYPEELSAKQFVRAFNKQNRLNVDQLLPSEVYLMAQKMENRAHFLGNRCDSTSSQEDDGNWVFGEQKMFCSILPYFCKTFDLQIDKMSLQNVSPLAAIFITKSQECLFFEINHILSLNSSAKSEWTPSDLQSLQSILSTPKYQELPSGAMKWKLAAFAVFQANNFTVFHPARDCRERWINHLDPGVSKDAWQTSEDLKLFMNIKKYGCRWALISKKMKNFRTEHMIKNRVNSLKRKFIRKPSVHLKDSQITLIINALQSKLAAESTKQGEDLMEIKDQASPKLKQREEKDSSDVQLVEEGGQVQNLPLLDIFDVINTERIVVTWSAGEQNWQYDEDIWQRLCESFAPSHHNFNPHPGFNPNIDSLLASFP